MHCEACPFSKPVYCAPGERHPEDEAALVAAGQGRRPEEVVRDAKFGLGMIAVAIVFIACAYGCSSLCRGKVVEEQGTFAK